MRHDRLPVPARQRDSPHREFWRQSAGLGHVPVGQYVSRCVAGFQDTGRTARAAVVSFGVSGGQYDVEWVELLVVFEDDCDGAEEV